MERLRDRVAVVTRGSRGFGFAIAELFSREGANVVIAARRSDKGTSAAKKIGELAGRNIAFIQCDMSREDEVKDLIHQVMEHTERIDILVDNAGINNRKDFEFVTEEEWDELMDINLKGSFLLLQVCDPLHDRAA